LGAAFSCYATFAIFPLVLLTVTVIGYVVGDSAVVRDRILASVGDANSPARDALGQTLEAMGDARARQTSAIVGILSLLFSASGAFTELDFTLNKIWQVKPRTGTGIFGMVKTFLAERLLGLACVAGLGLMMILSLVTSSVLSVIAGHAPTAVTPALLRAAELVASVALVALGLAAAFHFVPRSRPPFRTVIGGAVLTSVLLTLLKGLFALYLSNLTSYSAYGVAGGVLALAMWIYVSAQITFFGATLTRVHCEMTKCPAAPSRHQDNAGQIMPAQAS
jgi:membrane protein